MACCLPKKFFCRFSLHKGSTIIGIVMCIVMLAFIAATTAQVITMKHEDLNATGRNAYGYSVTAILYTTLILVINLWFIWGAFRKKSSVVLCWVVIMSMWLVQTTFLLLVLIIMYHGRADLTSWLFCLFTGLAFIGLMIYFIVVGYAYWMQLKNVKTQERAQTDENQELGQKK